MRIDHKILNELSRYKEINNYIMEQDVPPPPPPAGSGCWARCPPSGAGARPRRPPTPGPRPPDRAAAGTN